MRFCSFCIGTLLRGIALEVVRKAVVSFVAPVGMNGYEVAWLHRFQAESWKYIILSGEIWGAFIGGLCFFIMSSHLLAEYHLPQPLENFVQVLWVFQVRFISAESWVFSLNYWICLQIMSWSLLEIDLPILKWMDWIVLCKSLVLDWQR